MDGLVCVCSLVGVFVDLCMAAEMSPLGSRVGMPARAYCCFFCIVHRGAAVDKPWRCLTKSVGSFC